MAVLGLHGPLSIFLSSLTAIPLAYMLNCFATMKDPFLILIAGVLALTFMVAVPVLVARNKSDSVDHFFYGML
jgi:hypothetical protein